jgi:hypothetical protein
MVVFNIQWESRQTHVYIDLSYAQISYEEPLLAMGSYLYCSRGSATGAGAGMANGLMLTLMLFSISVVRGGSDDVVASRRSNVKVSGII